MTLLIEKFYKVLGESVLVLRKDLLAVFFLITVAPFCAFVHLAPLGDFWPFFMACSAVVICTTIGLGVANFKQNSLLVSPLVGLLSGFFLFLCLLTAVQNVSINDQLILVIYSVIVVLTALLAVQLAQKSDVQYYDYLAIILVVGGVVQSIGAIAIQYRLMGIDYWMVPVFNRLIGFIAQSNQLAIYMMVAFLALSYLTLRRLMPIVIAIVIGGLFGFILFGSGSRAVLVYLILSVIITLFCLIKSKDKTYVRFVFLILALILGAIVYYYLPTIIGWFSDDSAQAISLQTSSSYGRTAASDFFRLSEIKKTFALFKEMPLLGVGFGNYAATGFWLAVQDGSYTFLGDLSVHSHNVFAQILAEFGAVGFLALLVIVGYIVVRFWQTPKTLQWWLVLNICCVYFVNSMLEYVLWRMQFVPLLVLVMVPLLSPVIKLRFSRWISTLIWVVAASIYIVMASQSLNTYAKSFFYNQETVLMDKADYQTFLSATDDLIWGREIQQQEFVNLSPTIIDFARQQQVTDTMLNWHPYAPVIVNKIQLLLLSGQVGDLERFSTALVRAYPKMVPSICGYFNGFNDLPNPQGLHTVKKVLDCRSVLSKKK